MRYKAILITEQRLERTAQFFGEDLEKIRLWAKAVLEHYPDGVVQVYERLESMIKYYKATDFE